MALFESDNRHLPGRRETVRVTPAGPVPDEIVGLVGKAAICSGFSTTLAERSTPLCPPGLAQAIRQLTREAHCQLSLTS